MKQLHLLAWIFVLYTTAIMLICGIIKAEGRELFTRREVLETIKLKERNPDRQAMLLAIAIRESALRIRIAEGNCLPHECDGGRAWGLWQVHKNAFNGQVWGSPLVTMQAESAARILRSQWHRCDGYPGVNPIIGRFRAYGGRGCEQALRDEGVRLALYQEIRGQL